MKKNLILTMAFIGLLSLVQTLTAQKQPMKFGKIEPEYFSMTSYPQDTAAEALILGDYGECRIVYNQQRGFIVEFIRHFRAKIFNKDGYDLADKNIILYHTSDSQEKIVLLKGSVYNLENGKVVESELDKKMVFKEVIDNKHDEYKFTLPNVREGSVIEYTYQVTSDFLSLADWQFEYSVPALWSEYRVSYPEYFTYKQLQKGYLAFDVSEQEQRPVNLSFTESTRGSGATGTRSMDNYQIHYNDRYFRWVKNNVPAFRKEPYMNAIVNYLTTVELELASYNPPSGMSKNFTSTWEKINEDLLNDEDFGLQLKKGSIFKDVAPVLKLAAKEQTTLLKLAFEHVRSSMKWDGRNRIYATQGLRNAYEKKSGSSADINLMLVALLRELGIQSDPVILSTRTNGMIHPAQIMLGQFNYVIASATIGDKTYLLDATEKNCPYTVLPDRCINGQGRIVSESKAGWVELNPSQKYEYSCMASLVLDEEGLLKGTMQRSFANYAALNQRIEVFENKDKDEYVRNLENENKGLAVTGYELQNLDSLYKSYTENLQVEITDFSQVAGNLIYLSPLLFDQWTSNPLKLEERKFPVDFTYPRFYKSVVFVTLPEGFVLEEKPAEMVISLPDGKAKYSYRIVSDGNKVRVTSILDISQSQYGFADYVMLKEFFKQMVNKQAEKIVFKKS